MRAKTKILIVSESPVLPTGMGEVIRLIFGTLLKKYPGLYELHQVALFHSYSVAAPRWPIYPTKGTRDKHGSPIFLVADSSGEITFREVLANVRPDIVFAFNDTHRVLHLCDPPAQRDHKLILYVNFDGFPFPPEQGPILNNADVVVTMSEFSKRVALASLPDVEPSKVHYMYSPADTERFRPVSGEEKAVLRARCFPSWMPRNAFVLGWVGRNQWRKQVWILYEVVHRLRAGDYVVCGQCGRVSIPDRLPPACQRNSPQVDARQTVSSERLCCRCRTPTARQADPLSDIYLWLHMPEDPSQQAWDRTWLEREFDVMPGRELHYTEGHRIGNFSAPSEMACLYQTWDSLLYLSGGEGFGIPAWEAMCSALPVIYTNYSSHAEFLARARGGLPCGGTLQPEAITSIWRMIADVPQAIEAVRKLYFDCQLGKRLGGNSRKFVERSTVEIQAERWHSLLWEILRRQVS